MPVGVATAEQKVVPVQVTAVGNVQAYTTVGVKSQVAGQIQQVHFTEGRDVKRGELLFTIDPRPLEAAVRQAEANVAKDRAQLRQTEAALGQRQAEVTQARRTSSATSPSWTMRASRRSATARSSSRS